MSSTGARIGAVAANPVVGIQSVFAHDKVKEAIAPLGMPDLPNAGMAPSVTDAAVGAAADKERKKAPGRAATILTGGSGLIDSPATVSRRTLLGV